MNALDRLGEEARDGELPDLAGLLRRLRERDGVADDELVDRRLGDPRDRRTAEDRVRAARDRKAALALYV